MLSANKCENGEWEIIGLERIENNCFECCISAVIQFVLYFIFPLVTPYREMNAKCFYLLLYSTSIRTISRILFQLNVSVAFVSVLLVSSSFNASRKFRRT
mgnify:CR=1 FL=1